MPSTASAARFCRSPTRSRIIPTGINRTSARAPTTRDFRKRGFFIRPACLPKKAFLGRERGADSDNHAGAVLAVDRLGAAAMELGHQARDVEAKAEVRLAARSILAQRDHRFEQLAL